MFQTHGWGFLRTIKKDKIMNEEKKRQFRELYNIGEYVSAQANLSLGPLGRFLRILLTDSGAQASIARNVAKRRKNPSALEYQHL